MKRPIVLLLMCFFASTAFCQTKRTGFTQLSVYTQMIEDADYWDTMYQYFMKEHQYRYVCITCPSFEPESCLVIGADSTLTLVTLDKQIYSYLHSGKKDDKRPMASRKSLTVSANFVKDLQNLIDLAHGIKMIGVKKLMDFSAFDTKKIDEYAKQAKESYGTTAAYKEFEQKSKGRSKEEEKSLGIGMMELFADFGKLLTHFPEEEIIQKKVAELQAFITMHYYTCTPEILSSLGEMYAGGGSMTENIDTYAGVGTAEFTAKAIRIYCGK